VTLYTLASALELCFKIKKLSTRSLHELEIVKFTQYY